MLWIFVYLWKKLRTAQHLFLFFVWKILDLFVISVATAFFITSHVNGKVSHDFILSFHWMKVRNRHKNENFALQKVVQSRRWISAFGMLFAIVQEIEDCILYLQWITAASHLRTSPTLFNQHVLHVIRLRK